MKMKLINRWLSKVMPMIPLMMVVWSSTVQAEIQLSSEVYRDDFDAHSCLRETGLSPLLDGYGNLVLAIEGSSSGLQTITKLSYGRYKARLRTDVGGGSVVAFYLMGVDTDKRNNPAYHHLHDEVDFELVNSLWREGQYMAKEATWINAYHHHSAIILPRFLGDDAGGSALAMNHRADISEELFNRHVLADMDRSSDFIGFNYNDGNYYTYIIDYGREEIRFAVVDDDDREIRSYTLVRQGHAWPQTAMYLAASIWSSNDRSMQLSFTGPYDYNFGRPMRAYFDYISYQPALGVHLPDASSWNSTLPWAACAMATPHRCASYNRDAVTCAEVGFSEGQVGLPWGPGLGQFRCVDSCLQWVGQG